MNLIDLCLFGGGALIGFIVLLSYSRAMANYEAKEEIENLEKEVQERERKIGKQDCEFGELWRAKNRVEEKLNEVLYEKQKR